MTSDIDIISINSTTVIVYWKDQRDIVGYTTLLHNRLLEEVIHTSPFGTMWKNCVFESQHQVKYMSISRFQTNPPVL